MLTTNITLAEKYDYLSDKFKKAFTFLRETDLASLPIGRTEIDGDEVYASVQSYTTMTVEECAFESHLEYFDVQYVVLSMFSKSVALLPATLSANTFVIAAVKVVLP